MKNNLNKLISILNRNKGSNIDIVCKDINQANQLIIALKRTGYNAYGSYAYCPKPIDQVSYYCVDLDLPIVFTTFKDQDYMITNMTNKHNKHYIV